MAASAGAAAVGGVRLPLPGPAPAAQELLADGAIGELAELYSAFHFLLSNPANIRLDAALGGGALADVGCYPIRLAFELFGGGRRASGRRGVGRDRRRRKSRPDAAGDRRPGEPAG